MVNWCKYNIHKRKTTGFYLGFHSTTVRYCERCSSYFRKAFIPRVFRWEKTEPQLVGLNNDGTKRENVGPFGFYSINEIREGKLEEVLKEIEERLTKIREREEKE